MSADDKKPASKRPRDSKGRFATRREQDKNPKQDEKIASRTHAIKHGKTSKSDYESE